MPPLVNAARPAGEWQTMGIIFRVPRFDKAGRKIEDAVLVQAVLNGQVVQRDVPLSGPTRWTFGVWEFPPIIVSNLSVVHE